MKDAVNCVLHCPRNFLNAQAFNDLKIAFTGDFFVTANGQ